MQIKRTIAAVAFVAMASQAYAADWQRYTNDAMGYSVSLPTDRFAIEKQTEGRLSLIEPGGSAQLDVFGVTNRDQLTVVEFRDMMEAADPNRRITYRAAGKSWFVLSGYLQNEPEPTIFYAKFMLNGRGTALSAFEISYPQIKRMEFDPLVERMEDSLTAPR